MKRTITLLAVCSVLSASGCGWLGIRDRSNDYLLAEETQPLVVPEDMDSNSLGQLYPLPEIAGEVGQITEFEVPRPQSAAVNTFEQLVKIQSLEGRRWIFINLSPSEVWPRLRSVLSRNGIPAERADGASGVIDTVWVKFSSDGDNSHRFRFSISPGVQLESAEIAILQNQASRGEEQGASWPAASDDVQREQDMLQMIATELANMADFGSVSLLAQNIGGDAKVRVVTPQVSDPYIEMALSFDRSWASVSYSAERGGFTVVDQDRTQGLLFVNYSEEKDEDEGWFSGWFGGDDRVEMNYRILVQKSGSNVEVRIVGAEGESLPRPVAIKLLTVLRANMT